MEQSDEITTVLVVDDEESIRFALEAYLLERGIAVATAASCEEATTRLAAHDYDLLISDLHLTRRGGEGLEILRRVHGTAPRTKLVLMTSFGSADLVGEARKHGCSTVLQKPFSLEVLTSLLERSDA